MQRVLQQFNRKLMKPTAVEFMIENIMEDNIVKKSASEWEEIFNQANKMFEQQMITFSNFCELVDIIGIDKEDKDNYLKHYLDRN